LNERRGRNQERGKKRGANLLIRLLNFLFLKLIEMTLNTFINFICQIINFLIQLEIGFLVPSLIRLLNFLLTHQGWRIRCWSRGRGEVFFVNDLKNGKMRREKRRIRPHELRSDSLYYFQRYFQQKREQFQCFDFLPFHPQARNHTSLPRSIYHDHSCSVVTL
jgi:hypothetical protein